MARPKAKAPARTYHISGQSIVRIDGKDFYLGKHDSPESIARYAVLIGIYQANGLRLPDDFEVTSLDERAAVLWGSPAPPTMVTHQEKQPVLVKHVTALFREHMKLKYKHAVEETRRHTRLCERLETMFGDVQADDFGPVKLKSLRDELIKEGTARTYINRLTNCVIAIFKHAVAGELIHVDRVHALKTLEPLRYGQTTAPETVGVEPADLQHVRATSEHLSPLIKSMLRVQIATGMRPKEIFTMRPCDIDRSGDVWIYTPSSHKTKHKGKRRVIPIVGDAREAIIDYLNRDPQAFCFSPSEATAWRHAVAASKRKTPLNQGNRPGTNRKESPQRSPGAQYTANSYARAIQRAAKAAKVPHWHPYQLRHLTATMVRAVLGIEETQALLGHSTAAMTAHYARESVEAATRAANVAPKL
jgi:integrase